MAFFRLDRNDISPVVTRLIARARNPEPVLRAMGTTFKSITEGNFNSMGAEFRPIPWPPLKDPPGKASILQRSTTMAKAFRLSVTSRTATLSNPTIYAPVHQFGATIKPQSAKRLSWVNSGGRRVFAKQVVIPPRPFYPVRNDKLTAEAETLIARAGERIMARQVRVRR